MRFQANILKFLLPFALIFAACQTNKSVDEAQESVSVDSIASIPFLKEGKLVVLMSNDISSYYILKGQPRGFEYDMLKALCKDLNLELEVKVVRTFEYLLDSLVNGSGDLAAGNITITKERKQRVDFSSEVLRTRQMLVQKMPENYKKLSHKQIKARLISDALELDGKTIHVSSGSSFKDRLENYAEENGLDISVVSASNDLGVADLMRMVSKGEIDYTVVDENIGQIHKSILKNVDISVPLSLSQSIAWAIPKGHTELKALLKNWIEENKGTTKYNMIYNKYFGSKSQLRVPENYASIQKGSISRYDDLIKEYAVLIEWDWRLLAAMINKESRFNPNAQSSFGATGLMQVMPVTAARFGVDSALLKDPELNIRAGTRFVQWLESFWLKRLEDSTQLEYFVLASYNAGPGHVLDAMYLAEKYGLDPQVWKGNVEVMLANKSKPKYYRDPVVKRGYCNGVQPVDYVKRVMNYYAFYKAFEEGANQPSLAQVSPE